MFSITTTRVPNFTVLRSAIGHFQDIFIFPSATLLKFNLFFSSFFLNSKFQEVTFVWNVAGNNYEKFG